MDHQFAECFFFMIRLTKMLDFPYSSFGGQASVLRQTVSTHCEHAELRNEYLFRRKANSYKMMTTERGCESLLWERRMHSVNKPGTLFERNCTAPI